MTYTFQSSIKWNEIEKISINGAIIERLSFDDASYYNPNELPVYINNYPIHTSNANVGAVLVNQVFEPVSFLEANIIGSFDITDTVINVNARIVIMRKEPMVQIKFIPIRWNPSKQIFEKLVKFDILADVDELIEDNRQTKTYTSESVLATGQWFKFRLNKSGIYKVTYNELSAMGFDMATNPSNIAVFGNGGGLLPEKNDDPRYDDLMENPIVFIGGEDGSLDPGDYLLFYGEGPVVWEYNSASHYFKYKPNYYQEYSHYFVTSLNQPGKRIQNAEIPSGDVDVVINDFDDYAVHDVDERNIAGIGRTWFGEIYDYTTEYEFIFDFPNVKKQTDKAFFRGYFAARAFSASSFNIYINNQLQNSFSINILPPTERYQYAKSKSPSFNFTPTSDQLIVKTVYQRSSSSSVGFLDFIEINVQRDLIFANDQMIFRKIIGLENNVAKYNLTHSGESITIWDVSTPVNPYKVVTQTEAGALTFKSDATIFKEYIAFTANNYLAVEFVEEVANQNLHGNKNIDYLIITSPEFLAEADSLADFHRSHRDLNVLVTTPGVVYNEFSSGGQDITAIRDFAKMLYDNSDPGAELKYMLLFGDASYDYKNILPDNSNFVPCWESVLSLNIVNSIASDDYFGFLDDGEGPEFNNDLVDIGIGRFVVKTVEEAKSAIDKTIHYSVNTTEVMEPWRNIVSFIADDGDGKKGGSSYVWDYRR